MNLAELHVCLPSYSRFCPRGPAEDAAIPEASDQKFDLEGFKRALEVQYVLEQGPQIEDFIAQAKALTAEDISFIDTHRKVIEAMSSAETRKAYIDGLSEEF